MQIIVRYLQKIVLSLGDEEFSRGRDPEKFAAETCQVSCGNTSPQQCAINGQKPPAATGLVY